MDELLALTEINWYQVAVGVITAFLFIKFIVTSYEWIIKKTGLETKKMREKREDHEMLVQTAQGLSALQERHSHDETEFREDLYKFIHETRQENENLRKEMRQYTQNRLMDRDISIEREKRLNSRIDGMVELNKSRDNVIEDIGNSLKKLTGMFIEKEITDIRFSILEFTSSLSNGKEYNKEAYDNIFRMYDKYERILEENNMENGLIEESMEFIREMYKEQLKKDFHK